MFSKKQPTTTGITPKLGVGCQSFTRCPYSMLLHLRQGLRQCYTLIYAAIVPQIAAKFNTQFLGDYP
jgi:hypothetical protein